mmetsp:Transcript_92341/g.270281  ORF Transcript_92341/g.270281 Transcript_92341/m.270281 type:complete len:208 (+) Transcript_92341:4509-5132(+)
MSEPASRYSLWMSPMRLALVSTSISLLPCSETGLPAASISLKFLNRSPRKSDSASFSCASRASILPSSKQTRCCSSALKYLHTSSGRAALFEIIVLASWSLSTRSPILQGSGWLAPASAFTVPDEDTSHFSDRKNSFCASCVDVIRLRKKVLTALPAGASRPHSGASPEGTSRRWREYGKQDPGGRTLISSTGGVSSGKGPLGHACL